MLTKIIPRTQPTPTCACEQNFSETGGIQVYYLSASEIHGNPELNNLGVKVIFLESESAPFHSRSDNKPINNICISNACSKVRTHFDKQSLAVTQNMNVLSIIVIEKKWDLSEVQ